MVMRLTGPGSPMAKMANQRWSRGLIRKEPAVGFMAVTYWQLTMVLRDNFNGSYQCV